MNGGGDDVSPASRTLLNLLRLGFVLLGLGSVGIGIWMFAQPVGWSDVFPAGISDLGPINPHFIRDVGGWLVAGGTLYLFASLKPLRFGGVALLVNLIGSSLHAAGHVMDLTSGSIPAKHWIVDFPGVFLPLLIQGILVWMLWAVTSGRYESHGETADLADDGAEHPIDSQRYGETRP
ncbi:MAG TPA: hypothetical protein VI541_05190 [Actinomycetota bacterium]|nr:hypothetical protein [Actinomycetota bacterium]